MKRSIKLLFLSFLCAASNIQPMEQPSSELTTTNPQLPERRLHEWYWFITHLRLDIKTKHLTVAVADFDPSVRIYDEETSELILTLQRIGLDGKGLISPSPSEDLSLKAYVINDGRELCEIYDKAKKILSLEVGGLENKLYSYRPSGGTDLKIEVKGKVSSIKSLIRLHPSYVYIPGEKSTSDFFKKLKEEYIDWKKNNDTQVDAKADELPARITGLNVND